MTATISLKKEGVNGLVSTKCAYSVITDTFYQWIPTSQILQVCENFSILKYNFRCIHFFVNQIAMFVYEIGECRFRYAGVASAFSGHGILR